MEYVVGGIYDAEISSHFAELSPGFDPEHQISFGEAIVQRKLDNESNLITK